MANALELMESLWGRVPTPSQALANRLEALQPRVLEHERSSIEREQSRADIYDVWRPFRMLRDRAERGPSSLRGIVSAMRPSHFDWAMVALPRPLRPLYHAVRPVRVFRDALSRFGSRAVRAKPPAEPSAATDLAALRTMRERDLRETTPLTFVTAIYGYGPGSIFGGRGWNLQYYIPSLINIANLGAPIVVFCEPADVRAIDDEIRPHFSDCQVIPYEFSQFEHFEKFMQFKKSIWKEMKVKDRNEMLGYLKSYWLTQVVNENPFGHDRYFWIDSGLSNHGIFPRRVGGVELLATFPPSHYHPRNRSSIFTPTLGNAIWRSVPKGKVFFCSHPFTGHPNREALESLSAVQAGKPREQLRIQDHLVAGIFGGHRTDVRTFHRLYAELLQHVIETRTYCLEEMVFSCVGAVHPELIHQHRFRTWYFHSPGEVTSYLSEEGDSFYKIFLRLLESHPPE